MVVLLAGKPLHPQNQPASDEKPKGAVTILLLSACDKSPQLRRWPCLRATKNPLYSAAAAATGAFLGWLVPGQKDLSQQVIDEMTEWGHQKKSKQRRKTEETQLFANKRVGCNSRMDILAPPHTLDIVSRINLIPNACEEGQTCQGIPLEPAILLAAQVRLGLSPLFEGSAAGIGGIPGYIPLSKVSKWKAD